MTQDEFDAKLMAMAYSQCDRWEQFRVAWDIAMVDGVAMVCYDVETDTLSVIDKEKWQNLT